MNIINDAKLSLAFLASRVALMTSCAIHPVQVVEAIPGKKKPANCSMLSRAEILVYEREQKRNV